MNNEKHINELRNYDGKLLPVNGHKNHYFMLTENENTGYFAGCVFYHNTKNIDAGKYTIVNPNKMYTVTSQSNLYNVMNQIENDLHELYENN